MEYCRDCARPADDRYTMRFDDIGKPPLYWCDKCGPTVHAQSAAFAKALQERGPEFMRKAEELIREAELEEQAKRN